ncbi:MAG: DUF4091 domain-containing protein, partial [bacterium]|nr:DUF4091 domain-containing protein [bacterium]
MKYLRAAPSTPLILACVITLILACVTLIAFQLVVVCPCGDGTCEVAAGENCAACVADCGVCDCDGDVCATIDVEGCASRCRVCPWCGNGRCDLHAGESELTCAVDCAPLANDCCVANPTPRCEASSVSACVCAVDPYCCDHRWDAVCAHHAATRGCAVCGCGDGSCVAQRSGYAVAVANSGFEQATDGDPTTPYEWSHRVGNGTVTYAWADGVAHTGDRSLHIANWSSGSGYWHMAFVDVIPGATYRLTVWVKLEDVTEPPGITIRPHDADAKFAETPNQDLILEGLDLGSSEWQKASAVVTARPSTQFFQILLTHRVLTGGEAPQKVWFDDLTIEDRIDDIADRAIDAIDETALRDTPETTALLASAQDLKSDREAGLYDNTAGRASLFAAANDLALQHQRLLRSLAFDVAAAEAAVELPDADPRMLVGWLDSTERIFLNDIAPELTVAAKRRLPVFAGEYEATQLAVVANDVPLTGIRATVVSSGLNTADISLRVVGHVNSPFPVWLDDRVFYQGWWPDPLFDLESIDLQAGQAGSFWLLAKIPSDQAPGLYTISISVSSDQTDPVNLELWIQVWEAELPSKWYLKKVFGFYGYAEKIYKKAYEKQSGEETYDVDAPFLHGFYDLLLDYRLGLTSIDRHPLDAFPRERLRRAVHETGQNCLLAAQITGKVYDNGGAQDGYPDFAAHDDKAILDLLRADFDWLTTHDLVDVAYFYGFDEQGAEAFAPAIQTFNQVKADTGIKTMSTIKDYSYERLGGALDALVVSERHYDYHKAAAARTIGGEVWEYITRNSIAREPVRSRTQLLRVFSRGADGFLLWQVINWSQNESPITEAFQTDWIPTEPGGFARGLLIYPGDFEPIGSIRLENVRDGIEDHDLLARAAELLQAELGIGSAHDAKRQLLDRLAIPYDPMDMSPAEVRRLRRCLAAFLVARNGSRSAQRSKHQRDRGGRIGDPTVPGR